jgi:hypothetical protein
LKKELLYLAFFSMAIACNNNNKTIENETVEDININELIGSDDYFKPKVTSVRKSKDSLEYKSYEIGDIDNDGTMDSANIIFNHELNQYKVSIGSFNGLITENNSSQILVKDVGDLNGDSKHEILVFLQSEESCWDEIKLYSYIENNWVLKYDGLTYQCTENNNYSFRKIDDKTIQFTTYGINKDSVDMENGDTLENIIPNGTNTETIIW